MIKPVTLLFLLSFLALDVAAQEFRDDFNGNSLKPGWSFVREPDRNRFDLGKRSGMLALRGSTVTLADTEVAPVFIGRRLDGKDFAATASIEFSPARANETAGLALRKSEREYYEFGIRLKGTAREVYVLAVIGSVRTVIAHETMPAGGIRLRVRGFPKYLRFSFAGTDSKFTEIGGVETKPLSIETDPDKVSVGLFASGNGIESTSDAYVDWFEYDSRPADPYADLVVTDPSLPPGYTIFSVEAAEKGIIQKYPFISRPTSVVPDDIEVTKGAVYARYGDREMHGDVFRRKGKKRLPAVIIVHGGAWITGHYTMETPLAIALAKRGYVTMTVEHRLSREKKYPAQIHDLKASVRWLRANASRFGIDPNRIGAVGASSGGHLVTLLGSTNEMPMFEGNGGNASFSSRVQSVVDIDGTATFVDPGNIEKEIKGPWNTNTTLTGYTYAQNPQIWTEASPITHVNPKSAPTLFLNSSSNRPYQQREEMNSKLLALGIRSEIVVVPDTPHPFWLFRPWFHTAVENIDRFFQLSLRKARK